MTVKPGIRLLQPAQTIQRVSDHTPKITPLFQTTVRFSVHLLRLDMNAVVLGLNAFESVIPEPSDRVSGMAPHSDPPLRIPAKNPGFVRDGILSEGLVEFFLPGHFSPRAIWTSEFKCPRNPGNSRMTNWRHTRRMGTPLSLRKSAKVLKSVAKRPVNHICSTLHWDSRSSRRLEYNRLRYP